MIQMSPAQCHNACAGHSTRETTPEMIPDAQRPQTPLSNGEMEENEKQREVGTTKRDRTGDPMVGRNSLMEVAVDTTWDHIWT